MADRLIRMTTALAVATVAAVAAVISYRHAYELVSAHGESGLTARLLPFTVDGLILAASMLILDASRRSQPELPTAVVNRKSSGGNGRTTGHLTPDAAAVPPRAHLTCPRLRAHHM